MTAFATAFALEKAVQLDGFAIVERALSPEQVTSLIAALDRLDSSESIRKRRGIFAVRNLLEASPEVRELAGSGAIRALVEPILGKRFFPVRGILFDKIPEANWKVPWHQDVTIAVMQRIEVEGFGPWSTKAHVVHVQPPAAILENMLTVRIHLDDCGAENGALRVLPGSHTHGKIAEREIAGIVAGVEDTLCTVGVGGVLLMRPLLLHASSPSTSPAHRRVIHLDFAADSLPDGLIWETLGTRPAESP